MERLKAEGKLLTAKQKEAQKRAQQMLEAMKAQGEKGAWGTGRGKGIKMAGKIWGGRAVGRKTSGKGVGVRFVEGWMLKRKGSSGSDRETGGWKGREIRDGRLMEGRGR